MTEVYRLLYSLVMPVIHSPSQARTASGATRRVTSWTVYNMAGVAGDVGLVRWRVELDPHFSWVNI